MKSYIAMYRLNEDEEADEPPHVRLWRRTTAENAHHNLSWSFWEQWHAGMSKLTTPGDGNCGFHAISDAVRGASDEQKRALADRAASFSDAFVGSKLDAPALRRLASMFICVSTDMIKTLRDLVSGDGLDRETAYRFRFAAPMAGITVPGEGAGAQTGGGDGGEAYTAALRATYENMAYSTLWWFDEMAVFALEEVLGIRILIVQEEGERPPCVFTAQPHDDGWRHDHVLLLHLSVGASYAGRGGSGLVNNGNHFSLIVCTEPDGSFRSLHDWYQVPPSIAALYYLYQKGSMSARPT